MQFLKDNALWYAVCFKKYSAVKFLLSAGANPKIIELPFREICMLADGDRIIRLITAGVNVHTGNDVALFTFVHKKCFKTVSKLIELGADVNSRPLIAFAHEYRSGRMLELLLDAGLDLSLWGNGSAFYNAAMNGDTCIMSLLCRSGRNYMANFNGDECNKILSIFYEAVERDNYDVVRYLLKAGLDKNSEACGQWRRVSHVSEDMRILLDDTFVPGMVDILLLLLYRQDVETAMKMIRKHRIDIEKMEYFGMGLLAEHVNTHLKMIKYWRRWRKNMVVRWARRVQVAWFRPDMPGGIICKRKLEIELKN